MSKRHYGIICLNFVLYLCVLIWVILFHGTLETLNSAFDPDLRSLNFYLYFNGRESILNMLIFVPVGLYIDILLNRKVYMWKFGAILVTTLLFEILQFIFAIGGTDIMDIINNSIGGLVGLAICHCARRILKSHFDKIVVYSSTVCTLVLCVIMLFVPIR